VQRDEDSPISDDLLSMLVCPACHCPVELTDGPSLLCQGCKLRYPIKDGVPIMLVDEAERTTEESRGQ